MCGARWLLGTRLRVLSGCPSLRSAMDARFVLASNQNFGPRGAFARICPVFVASYSLVHFLDSTYPAMLSATRHNAASLLLDGQFVVLTGQSVHDTYTFRIWCGACCRCLRCARVSA